MKMKVVQCWDDGVVTDIRLIEILRKYGAKATFNLNPGLMKEERQPCGWVHGKNYGWSHKGFYGGKIGTKEMTEIYAGFEVASHNWRHENAGQVPDDVFIKSASDTRKFLEDKFQRECRGFAWPCGLYTPTTMALLHEAGFAYGRTTKNVADVTKYDDSMALHSNCHFQDSQFWAKYDAAKTTGVFYFWGHSYENFEYDGLWGQLEEKIQIITEDPDTEWANVIDIVK